MSGGNPARLGTGVGVGANAPLSIVSPVIGGGLVFAGRVFVKRAEDKRVWLIACRRAATANDRRRAGYPWARWRRPPAWSTGRRRLAGSGRFRAAISRHLTRPWGTASSAFGGRGTNGRGTNQMRS